MTGFAFCNHDPGNALTGASGGLEPYLRDTLLMLSSEEDCPCDAAGVLALEEERFRLAVLEAEDLAVTTDVELALS